MSRVKLLVVMMKLQDNQWALELSTHVLRVDDSNELAHNIRTQALKRMAEEQTSANGRNYLLTSVLEDADLIQWKFNVGPMVHKTPLTRMFRVMATRLLPDLCGGQDVRVRFDFTDSNATFHLHMRNSILEVNEGNDVIARDLNVHVITTEAVWRGMAAREKYPAWEYVTGALVIKPGLWKFKRFMDCFDRTETYFRQI